MSDNYKPETGFYTGLIAVAALVLYLITLHSYLLFHSLIEIVTIAVGFTLFILTWNTREYLLNSYLRMLGIGYAAIAVIDLLHTLAFKGMNVFAGYGSNLPTQLWIVARYLQAFTLLGAPFLLKRSIDNRALFGGYAAAVSVLVAMAFSGHFPDCYVEGRGLTAFKIGSEYAITTLLLASLYLFYLKRKQLDDRVFFLASASIACTILSELSFTAYVSVYGFANLVGHVAKLVAFYLIYRAILVTGIKDPLELIFRELKQAEEALRSSQETLEEKVRERTAELRDSEERYRWLIHSVPTAIVLHDGSGQVLASNLLAEKLLGLSSDQLIGKTLIDPDWHFVREDGSLLPISEYPVSLVLSTHEPLRDHTMGISRPDRGATAWMLVNADPKYDDASHIVRVIVSFVDITERKRAEQALYRLNRELRAISNCNQTLMRAMDEKALLDDVCRIICDDAGYRMAWVVYAEKDEARTLRLAASAGIDNGYSASARLSWAEGVDNGRGPSGQAFRSGETVYVQNVASDPRMAPWRESALQRGYHSCLALPLKNESASVFGVLEIYSGDLNAFTADEVRLLEELAGDLAYGIVTLRTRSEHEWMEKSLAKSEQEFRTLAENSPDVIVRYDRECRRIYVNPAFERVNHLSAQEVLGTRPTDLSTELAPIAVSFTEQLKEAMETGTTTQIDLQWTKNGKENCWFVRAIPERDANGIVSGALTIWTDITNRKLLEIALRESEQKFRSLAENSPENIFRYDQQCRIIYANHQVRRTLLDSGEIFLGKTPLERAPNGHFEGGIAELENYQSTLKRVISTGEMADVEMHVPDPSGALRTHSVRFTVERDQDGQIVGALAFGRDITEKARLEEQLRQSQKMEAIGQLAGGVAHDFNNILTAIIGFSSLAKMKMLPDDPQKIFMDHILASSDRAAHLTQSLLAFSRKQVLIPKPVDLNAIVTSIDKLLRRLIGEDIEFTTRLSSQSLIVMADAGQIEQVLMNLVTNARDAMPEGGELSISTELKVLGKDFTEAHGYGEPGHYALITVADTGFGMDEATRGKIFEPFFTTKEQGKGTGLGLSMVYGIVKQHDGNITVYSEPEKGTTFRILLPLIVMEVEEAPSEADAVPSMGTETVLLAEDDEDVRTMTTTILTDHGYHVIGAVDGKDALEKYRLHAQDIDLVILDVIMPKLSGKDVYDAVKAANPEAKILFISGYTADALQKKGIFREGVQFVAKPMSPFELLRKVRGILDGQG